MDYREIIIEEIKKQTGKNEITGDMNLYADLGLSSLEAMELISNVEEKIEMEIDEEALAEIATVDDFIDSIISCAK